MKFPVSIEKKWNSFFEQVPHYISMRVHFATDKHECTLKITNKSLHSTKRPGIKKVECNHVWYAPKWTQSCRGRRRHHLDLWNLHVTMAWIPTWSRNVLASWPGASRNEIGRLWLEDTTTSWRWLDKEQEWSHVSSKSTVVWALEPHPRVLIIQPKTINKHICSIIK